MTAFKGDDRFVADYLRLGVVLAAAACTAPIPQTDGDLRPPVGAFLRRRARGERLSGRPESLERSNLFVEPLDRNGQSYRCHQLVRELLRAQLEQAEPDLVPQLLARATAWSEANGQPEAAIGYAQDAGDVESASRLVERCALPAYESGRVVARRALAPSGWRSTGRSTRTRPSR